MNNFEAFLFLSRCLSHPYQNHKNDPWLENVLKIGEIDWKLMINIADQHLAIPPLFWSLSIAGLLDQCPDNLRNLLTTSFEMNHKRNGRLRKQAIHIALRLNEVGIEPVFLKGMAGLFHGIYPSSGLRMMGDIDILIPPKKIDEGIGILKRYGYHDQPVPDPEYHNPDIRHHDRPLYHDDYIARVEIHRAPVVSAYAALLDTRKMSAASLPQRVGNAQFRLPCPTHFILHNLIHAQMSAGGNPFGQLRLYQLLDLPAAMDAFQNKIDWLSIKRCYQTPARKDAFSFYGLAMNHMFNRTFPLNIPKTSKAALAWRTFQFQMNHPRIRSLLFFFFYFSGIWDRSLKESSFRHYIFNKKLTVTGIIHQLSKLPRLFFLSKT